jgi:hypothetical protein
MKQSSFLACSETPVVPFFLQCGAVVTAVSSDMCASQQAGAIYAAPPELPDFCRAFSGAEYV